MSQQFVECKSADQMPSSDQQESMSAGLPLSLGTMPATFSLDDSCSSNDSVHQFLQLGGQQPELTCTPQCSDPSIIKTQFDNQHDLDNNDEDNESNDSEIMMIAGTNSPFDWSSRTRPPSPRHRNIAVAIPFRSVVSGPAASPPTSPAATAYSNRQRKKRQVALSNSSNNSNCSSNDDLFIEQKLDENQDFKKRRRFAAPLGDASNLPPLPMTTTTTDKAAVQSKLSLGRCMSESCHLDRVDSSARIDKAIASIDSLNLIGNSEQTHSLPTVKSLDYGIRSVTPATVAGLLRGQFSQSVANYVIVDCRYPFEFDGGHIRGAVNLYQPEKLLEQLLPASGRLASPSNQMVIIFHCEFSSQRAPRMARLLRQRDRELNADNYPQLHYPEIYLLQGGYKAFYEDHQADCEPPGYTRMNDSNYSQQLIRFEKLGRAWERQNSRSKHSRLQRLAGSPQLK